MHWRGEAAFAAIVLAVTTCSGATQPVPVNAIDASEPTQCAETDNVYIRFVSPSVRRFTVEARHPHYLRQLTSEDKTPDFRNCDMGNDPMFHFIPRRVTLYDDEKWQLFGFVYPNFWRSAHVPVKTGARAEHGLHLLQLWTKGRARDEEVLVLYPADGYWRARPLAPRRLHWRVDLLLPTAYGSSFMIGPVEEAGRPFVDLNDVLFSPEAGSFTLKFARGGAATLRIADLDTNHIRLTVNFDRAFGAPFAAFRSMYVNDRKADASRVAWRPSNGKRMRQSTIEAFRHSEISEFWLSRRRPSRHNNTAPDLWIGNFRGGAATSTGSE